jgi:hypothetical protein
MSKYVGIGCEASDWEHAELYMNSVLFSFFFISSNAPQTKPHMPSFAFDGSNDAVWLKAIAFWGRSFIKLRLGVQNPQKPQNFTPKGDFPAN